MTAVIVRADAAALPLADATVDLVVTSPPYWSLRAYTDGGGIYVGQLGAEATPAEYIANLLRCTREWVRVLKPTGSLWVNLGDKYNAYNGGRGQGTIQRNEVRQSPPRGHGLDVKGTRPKSLLGLPWRYALGCIDQLGLILRAEVIWSKPNGLPESVTDRVRRSHEQWFHLTKEPRYYSAIDAIREEHAPAGLARRALPYKVSDAQRAGRNPVLNGEGFRPANPAGKVPGTVWNIPTQPLKVPAELGVSHHAAFPMEWPRRIILGWSRPSAVVVDPFGGTGTTALVASALGRVGISADLSADYCRIARWRTADPGQRAKAVGAPPARRRPSRADRRQQVLFP